MQNIGYDLVTSESIAHAKQALDTDCESDIILQRAEEMKIELNI